MPKVSVYLPDELYRRARERGLSLSAVTQQALMQALESDVNAQWVQRARERAERQLGKVPVAMSSLKDEVREEFGA